MGRPRQFDRIEALDKAVQVFWSRGFEATSIQNLVEAMGINRASLYDTFGDKHRLFVAALTRYADTVVGRWLDVLGEGPGGLVAIERFFVALIDYTTYDTRRRACLLTNTAAAQGGEDGFVTALVADALATIEDRFHAALTRAQGTGEISADANLRAIARSLAASTQGMLVLSKLAPGREALDDIARGCLRLVRGGANA